MAEIDLKFMKIPAKDRQAAFMPLSKDKKKTTTKKKASPKKKK